MTPPILTLTEMGAMYLSSLTFDEKEHRYTCLGKPVLSVTQLLERQGLAPRYDFVPKTTMEVAADRGTTIHKEIEEYNKIKAVPFTEEAQFYMDLLETNNIIPLLSECKVTDGVIAGTFDELLCVPDDEDPNGYILVLVDNKTTSSIHWESVAWQLSIYAHLFYVCYGIRINKTAVIWLPKKKYGKYQLRYVDMKPEEEVLKVIEAEKNDQIYQQTYPCSTDIIAELEGLKLEKEKVEKRIKELTEQVLNSMAEKGVNTFDTGYAKFTKVVTEGKELFDYKKYQEENPTIDYSKYMKKGAGSTSLKITFKKEK